MGSSYMSCVWFILKAGAPTICKIFFYGLFGKMGVLKTCVKFHKFFKVFLLQQNLSWIFLLYKNFLILNSMENFAKPEVK